MDTERSSSLPGPHRRRWGIAEWLFALLLLLALVGLDPLRSRDALSMIESSDGDTRRQIAYLLLFGLLAVLTIDRRSFGGLTVVPVMITLTIAWFFAGTLWSVAPGITFRRAALTAVTVWSVFMSVGLLGAERAWEVLYRVLAALLVVNLISVAVFPQAVHLPGEADPALVGNWRGMHFHKNHAGLIAGLSTVLFFSEAMKSRRLLPWSLFLTGALFTLGTQSKTSLALLVLSLVVIVGARRSSTSDKSRRSIRRILLWCIFGSFISSIAFFEFILETLNDPKAFTGRTAIWNIVIQYARDNILLGSGYSAFWQSGEASPALDLAADWAVGAAHSHNGYLELLATTGLIGLTLGAISAFIIPMLRLLRILRPTNPLLLSWLLFLLIYNVTEVGLYQGDRAAWIFHLITISILYNPETLTKSKFLPPQPIS
ncbi:MAG: O-antigen ligase family protein [Pannonibacter sp.]